MRRKTTRTTTRKTLLRRIRIKTKTELCVVLAAILFALLSLGAQRASAQQNKVVYSADEQPIADQIHGLRALADDVRATTTKDLALQIRKLPATENKLRLAVGFAADDHRVYDRAQLPAPGGPQHGRRTPPASHCEHASMVRR